MGRRPGTPAPTRPPLALAARRNGLVRLDEALGSAFDREAGSEVAAEEVAELLAPLLVQLAPLVIEHVVE